MSSKGDTNRKWTSTDKYRENYDNIFGKKDAEIEEDEEVDSLPDGREPVDSKRDTPI